MTEDSNVDRKPLRTLANGTQVDEPPDSVIVKEKKTPPGMITTSERGRELRARRTELQRQEKERQDVLRAVVPAKARKAIAKAIGDAQARDGLSAADALAEMAGMAAQSYAANLMDKPREAVMAGKFAVGFTGYATEQRQVPAVVVAVQIQHIGEDVARLADDVIEGTVVP